MDNHQHNLAESGDGVGSRRRGGNHPHFRRFKVPPAPPVRTYTDPSFITSQNMSGPTSPTLAPDGWESTSGQYVIQNQNEHQIYIPHDHHDINNDEEVVILERAMADATADDELGVAMLESDINYFLIRGSGSGLPENAISNHLKTRKWTHQNPSSSDICVVCQNDICLKENADEELIATLDCRHEFHADCIKQWLKQKNICPLCKAKALPLDS